MSMWKPFASTTLALEREDSLMASLSLLATESELSPRGASPTPSGAPLSANAEVDLSKLIAATSPAHHEAKTCSAHPYEEECSRYSADPTAAIAVDVDDDARSFDSSLALEISEAKRLAYGGGIQGKQNKHQRRRGAGGGGDTFVAAESQPSEEPRRKWQWDGCHSHCR